MTMFSPREIECTHSECNAKPGSLCSERVYLRTRELRRLVSFYHVERIDEAFARIMVMLDTIREGGR
jgi:hypothetical protein